MRRMILCFIFSLLAAAPVSAATVQQYDSALIQVQQVLQSRIADLTAHQPTAGQAPDAVAEKLLAPITRVGPPQGPAQIVNNAPLLQQLSLAYKTNNLRQLKSLSQQIQTLHALLAPVPSREKGAANAVPLAHTILSQPPYASLPYPPPSLSERIAKWIDRELAKLHWLHPHSTHHASKMPNISPAFIKVLLYLLLGGVLTLLIALLVQLLSRRQARTRAELPLDSAEDALVEARDNESLFALAEQQSQAGEYRRAFRLIYLAALIALDTGGILRFNRSRTNWEYLRALRAADRNDIYRALVPFTREFDRVWYGFAPATKDDYERAVAQYHALQAAAPLVPAAEEASLVASGPPRSARS